MLAGAAGDKLAMLAGRVLLARETAMSNRYARALAAGGAAVVVAALGIPASLAAAPGPCGPEAQSPYP